MFCDNEGRPSSDLRPDLSLEDFRQGQDSCFGVVRLSFGNFQNGLIALVQHALGHLGHPTRHVPATEYESWRCYWFQFFWPVGAEKSDWLSLVRSD